MVNGYGQVFKTPDSGASWQLQKTLNSFLRSVGFADARTGWVGTLDPRHPLYATADGGTTWRDASKPSGPRPAGICGLCVVSRSVIFGSGRYDGPAIVMRSTDGGTHWASTDLRGKAAGLTDCYFADAKSGFVVGWQGSSIESGVAVVLSTADGGTTWVTRYRGTRHAELGWKVTFSSARVGYVSIQPFHDGARYFLKTTDGGHTWHDKVFTTDDYDAQGIGFVTDTHGWIGGRGTGTYETYDGGETLHTNPDVGTNVNRFRHTRDGAVYAVGETVSRY